MRERTWQALRSPAFALVALQLSPRRPSPYSNLSASDPARAQTVVTYPPTPSTLGSFKTSRRQPSTLQKHNGSLSEIGPAFAVAHPISQ